jgi:hypothetical protein
MMWVFDTFRRSAAFSVEIKIECEMVDFTWNDFSGTHSYTYVKDEFKHYHASKFGNWTQEIGKWKISFSKPLSRFTALILEVTNLPRLLRTSGPTVLFGHRILSRLSAFIFCFCLFDFPFEN